MWVFQISCQGRFCRHPLAHHKVNCTAQAKNGYKNWIRPITDDALVLRWQQWQPMETAWCGVHDKKCIRRIGSMLQKRNWIMKWNCIRPCLDPRLNWSLKQSSVASEFPFFCKRMTRRTKWWTLDWLDLWFAILFFCVFDGFTGNLFLCLLGTMFLQLANIVKMHELQWCIIVQGACHSHNLVMFMPCCSIGNNCLLFSAVAP